MLTFLGVVDAASFWQNGLFARERGGLVNLGVVLGILGLGAARLVILG